MTFKKNSAPTNGPHKRIRTNFWLARKNWDLQVTFKRKNGTRKWFTRKCIGP